MDFCLLPKNMAKNMGKNISQNLSGNYSQKLHDHAKLQDTEQSKKYQMQFDL